MHRITSQRQTRSLDNIVENPDSWRFHEKLNSNILFINEEINENSSTKIGTSSSNNKNDGEKIEM